MNNNTTLTVVGLVCGVFLMASWILVWVYKIQAEYDAMLSVIPYDPCIKAQALKSLG